MCTETFLRLPEEKRERFLEAAWEEFTHVSFAEASINQIVRRAGIPRGSFYQYFADKENLFAYLEEIVLKHLVSEYRKVMCQAGGDLFETQMMCFDRVCYQGDAADSLFERCLKIVRLNPDILPQTVMGDRLVYLILDAVWDVVDFTGFHSREREFVAQVMLLTLMPLAVAVGECLCDFREIEKQRQILQMRLEIVKRGSLSGNDPKCL